MKEIQGRFTVGDPLRAVAALGILSLHVMVSSRALMPGDADSQRHVMNGAYNALYLFFALSGYLIARPFLRAFIRGAQPPRTRDYLRNRFLRIVPAFWAVAAFVLLLEAFGVSFAYGTGVGVDSRTTSAVDAVSVFAFVQNLSDGSAVLRGPLGPAWSLHVEIVFYLLLPLVAVAAGVLFRDRWGWRARTAFVLGCCASVFAASVVLRSAVHPGDTQALRHFHSNCWAFVPGIALAAAEPIATQLGQRRFASPSVAAIGLSVLFALTIAVRIVVEMSPAIGSALTISAGWGLVLGVLLTRQWAGLPAPRALDNRLLHWLGARSYGIFLVNWLVIVGVSQLPSIGVQLSFFETLIAVAVLSAGVAEPLHRWVELPCLHRNHQLRPNAGAR